MPTFATVVGVAPSTTTMELGAPHGMLPIEASNAMAMIKTRADAIVPTSPIPRSSHQRRRYYVPYASIEDLRSAGLGVVNESDAWLTGRPYGLPGTSAIRLTQQHGGYNNPQGYHYNASMIGGGFGDADTANAVLQLQQIQLQQQAQAAALKRIAFWQTAMGVVTVTAITAGVISMAVRAVRKEH